MALYVPMVLGIFYVFLSVLEVNIKSIVMKVKIVNKSAWPLPAYATEKSAGMDLKADISAPVSLAPLGRGLCPRRTASRYAVY